MLLSGLSIMPLSRGFGKSLHKSCLPFFLSNSLSGYKHLNLQTSIFFTEDEINGSHHIECFAGSS